MVLCPPVPVQFSTRCAWSHNGAELWTAIDLVHPTDQACALGRD
jgi:hypothetical protein